MPSIPNFEAATLHSSFGRRLGWRVSYGVSFECNGVTALVAAGRIVDDRRVPASVEILIAS